MPRWVDPSLPPEDVAESLLLAFTEKDLVKIRKLLHRNPGTPPGALFRQLIAREAGNLRETRR